MTAEEEPLPDQPGSAPWQQENAGGLSELGGLHDSEHGHLLCFSTIATYETNRAPSFHPTLRGGIR